MSMNNIPQSTTLSNTTAGTSCFDANHIDVTTIEDLEQVGSDKWTRYPGCIGAFIAEMDYGLAPCVAEAIEEATERGALGYIPDPWKKDYRHHRFDHLHLVAPPSICSTIAARTVVKLSMFTDIELSLIQMEPPEAIGLISQGKADTAAVFRYSSIPNFLHIGDDLTFHSLGYDPMRLLVRRSSGIAKRFEETGEPVPLSAAKDEHWIAGCPTCRANLVKLATRAGFKPDIRHCTDDYWATQNLVEVGMGVSLVPALDTHINLQGDLVACPIADDFAAREVGIVTRAGDHRPALGSLLEELERTSLKYLSAK